MKELIRKFTPDFILATYHFCLSWLGNLIYGYPSEKMVVIGITGTNGKTTVANLIAAILEEAGYRVGLSTSYNFRIAGREELNITKLTMPGRFFLQKKLKEMASAGCQFAVLETSSEGLLQWRHRHIHYDCAVFTNLTPEHLERHGGFENYKQAKLSLFRHVQDQQKKYLNGKKIKKTIVVNADDGHAPVFLDFRVDQKLTFSLKQRGDYNAKDAKVSKSGIEFDLEGVHFQTSLLGDKNISNCLAAVACTRAYGVGLETAAQALHKRGGIPGRMELIEAGQSFQIMVDYAPEPASLQFLYDTIAVFKKNRIIHVLGSAGGGRDRARRRVLGSMAGRYADIVIVTNEDPYDESPEAIIDEVAQGAEQEGKKLNQGLFKLIDRRSAIRQALSLAQPGDLVIITGKGAEQLMALASGRKIPWDDRRVAREELEKISNLIFKN